MKTNFLYSCLIALASLGFVACDSEENEKETKVPDGAKPYTRVHIRRLRGRSTR